EAIMLLTDGLAKSKPGHDRAALCYQLGMLYRNEKRWEDAAEQFDACFQLRPARTLALDALYEYGYSRYALGQYELARDAFGRVAQSARDWEQAYQASVYLARTEMHLQHFEDAETILKRLSVSSKFSAHTEEIPLELADLTLESGRMDEAITLYQDYVLRYPSGTLRGIAYYRLALIHRDRLINLPVAKAYLDSTSASSPPAEIADSARVALNQISKGLLAMSQVAELSAELANIEARGSGSVLDTLSGSPIPSPEPEPTEGQTNPAETDSAVTSEQAEPPLELPTDQSITVEVDSLPHSVSSDDSVSVGGEINMQEGADSLEMNSPPNVAQETPAQEAKDPETLRRSLQRAYLHVAEFYGYSLVDMDSALSYYEKAAESSADPQVYWKANLRLAEYLSKRDGGISEEARRRYQTVVDADSVPLEAANLARSALGLPRIEIPTSPQEMWLYAAEEAYDRGVPLDSVVRLYDAAIAFDSTSEAGQKALFAKAFVYEQDMHRMNWAQTIYEDLLARFPDSSYAERLRRKLVPPDSESVFLLTDAQLMGARAAAVNLLEETPDETGWPPPEESLQGRRFR
ncbi:MAG: tetratricopeptide repeat protein, partial [bacterium]|nr:tetratricopeptide repeat protein [bacterium]